MRRFIFALLLIIVLSIAVGAQTTKVSDLQSLSTLDGTELLLITKTSGAASDRSRKMTFTVFQAQLTNAAADGSTKGIATFTAADFNASSGVISIDYTNAQAADASHKGFLTSADWSTFNGKQAALGFTAENSANKDATGGYAGLTLFKINFKNAANTFTSFFTNSNSAARTYTFQNRDGTIADDTDLAAKAPLASPVFTGTPSGPSFAFTGTAGLGFGEFPTQSSAPSAPATGYREYADSTGRRSWIRASDGFTRTWDATLTANRIYTLQDLSGSVVLAPAAGGILFAGPTAPRVITVPDAAFTAARIDAGQTFIGNQVVSSGSFGLSGNISSAAWTTSGIRYKNVAATLTDTSSSGTVATAYTDVWGGNTIAASSATTFTNYFGSYFNVPAAGSNVTLTNAWAVGADSLYVGSTTQAETLLTTANTITHAAVGSATNIDIIFSPKGGGSLITGKLLNPQNGISAAGQILLTSNSSTAFASGPNGATNPVFSLVNNTASQKDGISITGGTSGAGAVIAATSDGSNSPITLTPKGTGSVRLAVAAPLAFVSGTNQRAGNATLVGGTVTVSNTTVTANTVVMLTRKTSGGTIGTAITYTLSAGTSFTITSDNILDTSVFSYVLIEVP